MGGCAWSSVSVIVWKCVCVGVSMCLCVCMCTHLDVLQELLPVPLDQLQFLSLPAAQLRWVWRETSRWSLADTALASVMQLQLHGLALRVLSPPGPQDSPALFTQALTQMLPPPRPFPTALSKSAPNTLPAFCPPGYRCPELVCILLCSLYSQLQDSRSFNYFGHCCLLSS